LHEVLAVAPSYAYAPLMLHVFRQRGRQNDSDEFAESSEPISRSGWPWPIFEFLQGKSDAAALISAAKSMGEADDHTGQICEANFFIGLEDAMQNKLAPARALLQLAARTCPHDYIAYGAAVAELKRLDALTPRAAQ
jgi:lipoprotein NlpI